MDKGETLTVILISFFLVLVLGIIFTITMVTTNKNQKEDLKTNLASAVVTTMEYAYMEGQRDYAEGDIRIEKIDDDWKWSSSPWDEGTEPVYEYLSEY